MFLHKILHFKFLARKYTANKVYINQLVVKICPTILFISISTCLLSQQSRPAITVGNFTKFDKEIELQNKLPKMQKIYKNVNTSKNA